MSENKQENISPYKQDFRRQKTKLFYVYDRDLNEVMYIPGKRQHNVSHHTQRELGTHTHKQRYAIRQEDSSLFLIYDVWHVQVPHKNDPVKLYNRGYSECVGQVKLNKYDKETFNQIYNMFMKEEHIYKMDSEYIKA